MEERRLLIALALSLLVLTAWRYLVAPPTPPESAAPAGTTPAASTPATAVPAPGPRATVAPAPVAKPSPVAPPAAAVGDERERRVEVDAPDVAVAFTNRGARLISWKLKRFRDAEGREEEMVQAAREGPRPLDIQTGDAALDAKLQDALYRASSESVTVTREGGELAFRFAEGDVEVRKQLHFEPQGYLASISVEVRRQGQAIPVRLLWGPGLGNPTPAEKEIRGYQPPAAVALTPEGVLHVAPEKLASPRPLPDLSWVGIDSHYFAALLVPPGDRGAGELHSLAASAPTGARTPEPVAALDMGTSGQPAALYVGPKDYTSLARLGRGLSRIVDVGDWIGPIVVVLMKLLRWVHTHIGNYGWSIVALTVLINLAMSPLRHYSIATGVKMAKIAPEMKVIQERYRGVGLRDKRYEQMQREMAALYAKHGMSMGTQMAVGCLPILLTMPFLFAFYKVLQVSIELRGAPFVWIPDLSAKDPLFITPVLMGASMLLMQRMTPTAMDPGQQRMMTIMPLVFMVMFFAAPAGLNLYWLASNVCSIAQQAVTQRIIRGEAPAPKAGRRQK